MRFAVSKPGLVDVTVHDVAGREVAKLVNEQYDTGEYELTWDGTGYAGERLGSGLYFIVVEMGGRKASQKLMLLR